MTTYAASLAHPGVEDVPAPSSSRSWWGDRSVKTKILLAVAVPAIAAGVIGATGMRAMDGATAQAEELYSNNLTSVGLAGDMNRTLTDLRVVARDALLAPTPEEAQAILDGMSVLEDEFQVTAEQYAAGGLGEGRQVAYDDLLVTVDQYVEFQQEVLGPLAVASDVAAWVTLNDSEGALLVERMTADIQDLRERENVAAERRITAIESSAASQLMTSMILIVVGLLVAVGLGLVVATGIARSTRRVQEVTDALATGDLTRTTGMTTRDELGRMGRALDAAVTSLREVMGTVVASAEAVAASSEQLSASSAQISASAEETSVQSGVVSAAAEQVSRSVQTVAAGTEQMGASIREISTNASLAAQIATQAVGAAKAANTTVNKLGASSAEIGNVVKVITTIAAQTNLLALNATIEAARAGEAGKGFAVVANEVKELAQETAKATEDIARRVEAIQADTTGAVGAIEEIGTIITSISDYQTTIAGAVEEQTATTNEMARSVAEAADGSGEIAVNITGVATAADSTTQALTQTQVAVDELSRMATELRGVVARFTY